MQSNSLFLTFISSGLGGTSVADPHNSIHSTMAPHLLQHRSIATGYVCDSWMLGNWPSQLWASVTAKQLSSSHTRSDTDRQCVYALLLSCCRCVQEPMPPTATLPQLPW